MANKNFSCLKKSKDFKLIANSCTSYKHRFFFVKIAKKALISSIQTEYPVLGVTISRKIGKAVIRNKIKRRIKAIFLSFDFNIEQSSLVYSFYVKQNIIYASYAELKNEVDKVKKNINKYLI